ncbi:MAG: prolyl oligopeptidase family serine peptidase [Thermomicrobiales bacterium]
MTQAPYGSWKSPITSELIVAGTIDLLDPMIHGQEIYWIEARPAEAGRRVVVRRRADGTTADITPAPLNARTRVHEYGGDAVGVHGGAVFFANFADQVVYRVDPGTEPRAITPNLGNAELRYADFSFDAARNRIVCIREDHRDPDREAINTVVALTLDGPNEDGGQVLVAGNDFYSNPRLSPDGGQLAWLTWNHPNMPWDGCELWLADVGPDGAPQHPRLIAGGRDESIFEPLWSPDGVLTFVSDRTEWWNLYQFKNGAIVPLCEMNAEFGMPQWIFGMSTYGFASAQTIVCIYTSEGSWKLATLNVLSAELRPVDSPLTVYGDVHAGEGAAVFVAGSPTESLAIYRFDVGSETLEVLRRSSTLAIDPGYLSIPQPIEFPTEDGLTAHGFFYPPTNKDFTAPADERPPLIVLSHGGPTAATDTSLDFSAEYWTSRGFAVLDVNYGGSTGYGRSYRQRLNDNWGIVDVDDCVNGAKYLVEQGLVDGNRLIIRGWSASGYTTLAALAFRDVFKAGASHFGVSELASMAQDTHKFESRYLDGLIGPYPAAKEIYAERSPINSVDKLNVPLILFQGLEDKVVPPDQAEMMYEAVKAKGIPVAYVPFEGEQHGFRKAENIRRALDGELYFLSRVFDFELAEPVEPVEIANLE